MRVRTASTAASRSRLGCGAALAVGVMVVLIVSVVSALLYLIVPGGNNVAASFIHAQPGSLPWNPHERLNVLILGTAPTGGQSAPPGSASGPAAGGAAIPETDTMIVASLDAGKRSVHLLSIPPDLWVTIPGYGQGRIAEAYGDGGPRLALLTVESVLHVPIPYYALVNAAAFRQVVDALGGVSVPRSGASPGLGAHRLTPVQHLSGPDAVRFARMTQPDSPGDVAEMHRQQELLMAVWQQSIRPQTFLQIPTIVNTLGGSIPTNFPYNQATVLAHALASVPASRIHRAMLDTRDGAITPGAGSGQDLLVGDWQRMSAIGSELFPAEELRAAPPVHVLNGTDVPGQASSLTDWLRRSGVHVSSFDSASSPGYPHTEVIVPSGSSGSVIPVARDIAALLQVPLVSGVAPTGAHASAPPAESRQAGRTARRTTAAAAPVVVLIGHDFQDLSQQ